jgi:hypothetical protein
MPDARQPRKEESHRPAPRDRAPVKLYAVERGGHEQKTEQAPAVDGLADQAVLEQGRPDRQHHRSRQKVRAICWSDSRSFHFGIKIMRL